MADRDNLTTRSIPHMELSHPSTHPSLPQSAYSAPFDSAVGRFALTGTAIVTGGTGTIALAVSRALLQHGLQNLMLFDLQTSSETGQKAINDLRKEFPDQKIQGTDVDVTNEDQVNAAVASTASTFGTVDAMICFAGIVGCHHALETPIATFRKILDVNTTGTFICAQAAAKQMAKQDTGGRVIFTASISAHRVNYPQPQAAYNASKAALVNLKMSLAAEWARYGITVNSVSPGYMDTVLNEGDGLKEARDSWCGRNPMGRMGFPEEVAGTVVMLCSRSGKYINGADIVVDGGGIVF